VNLKLFAMLSLMLALCFPTAAALARIDDTAGALTTDVEMKLSKDLGQFGTHQFDVVLVQHVDGSITRFARKQFQEHRLDADDGLIAIAIGDRKVGVHLGQIFKEQGVGNQQIETHLRSDFFPQARTGRFDTATVQLAKGLIQEAQAAPPIQPRGQHQGPTQKGGFALLLIVIVTALLIVGVWWTARTRLISRLSPRIKALKGHHANLVSQALRLDDVDTLGRFREGKVAKQYQTLARQSGELIIKSMAFGERLVQAEQRGKQGKADAEGLVRALEGQITGLQAEVATALTMLDRLEGTSGLSGSDEDLPKLVARLTRRYDELREAYAQIARRAPDGYDTDATVERRLREANQLLITPPVDVKSAEELILETADALEAYRRTVDGEQDREALRQGHAASAWADTASALPYLMLQSSYHRPYFSASFSDAPVMVVHDHDSAGVSIWGSDGGGAWDTADAHNDSGSEGGGYWDTAADDYDSGSDGGGSWDD